jgi:hypothetical protein
LNCVIISSCKIKQILTDKFNERYLRHKREFTYRVAKNVLINFKVYTVPRPKVILSCKKPDSIAQKQYALNYKKHCASSINWPIYFSDLNKCDFLLRGYLKDRLDQSNPKPLDELKPSTEHQIFDIRKQVLHSVISNSGMRLQKITEVGQHIEHITT